MIVVGSVLEKHVDGDFTPDQEKGITFKRWPPGYQSWKLGLALNGLRQDPLEAILAIFGYKALIFFGLKALGKNDSPIVLRSGDHFGDAKMSKEGILLCRV